MQFVIVRWSCLRSLALRININAHRKQISKSETTISRNVLVPRAVRHVSKLQNDVTTRKILEKQQENAPS